jgi:adenylate cyclase
MEPKGYHRKLAAIRSADVAGYSRLMQDDEAATVATLETYKRIISDLVKQNRSRVVDSPGDNLLADFASVVDAVQCAVAVQKELQTRNSELLADRKMLFRIGVNLGDVIQEGERIYGDGVNIAARLETLADPGASASPRPPSTTSSLSCRWAMSSWGSRWSRTSLSRLGHTVCF